MKIVGDGSFRQFYALGNNNLLDWSKLGCTKDDFMNPKQYLNKTEWSSRITERTRTQIGDFTSWQAYRCLLFHSRTYLWVGGKIFYHNHCAMVRNCTINQLMFEENTRQPGNDNLCLFCTLVLHLHWKHSLEEKTSKIVIPFRNRYVGLSRNQFKGEHLNDIPVFEDLLALNSLL